MIASCAPAPRRVVLRFLLVMTTLTGGGCGAMSRSSSPPPEPPADVTRVYYATDREPIQSGPPYFGAERGGLKFGRADVAVMTDARPGNELVRRPVTAATPRADRWVHGLVSLDLQRLSAVRAGASTGATTRSATRTGGTAGTAGGAAPDDGGIGDQPVLIFVHGFNVTPESAMATAAQLGYDLGFTGAVVAFVWPSRAAIDRYASDEESAQWAAPHLAELIRRLKDKPERPVHLVAHSMGSRVTCAALQRLACGHAGGGGGGGGGGGAAAGGLKLGQLVLAAPDIDADIFKAQVVDEIRPIVTGITVYASTGDAALKVSQRLHQWTRAGETGDWVPAGERRFEMVDCSGLDLSRSVGSDMIGHSYYAADYVVEDMQAVLGTSSQPRRATRSPGGRYLTLPPKRVPSRWAAR